MHRGTVKLSRICPFCGRILLDQRLRINDLAVAAGGENAAKLLNLTVPTGLSKTSADRLVWVSTPESESNPPMGLVGLCAFLAPG